MAVKLAVIWIHGLGDRGSSWRGLEDDAELPGVKAKWMFPDAPTVPVTCNGGARSTSWFDIEDIPVTQDAKDYPKDIEKSVTRIHAMVGDLEKEGYASNEIVIGGFSQGGAMALQAVLRYPKPLAGVCCCSGWLMMRDSVGTWANGANKDTPIFWGHGRSDNVVVFALQQIGVAALSEANFTKVTAKDYATMHSTTDQEHRDIGAFLAGTCKA
mmetsp:Transcript_62136/g.147220  ORF Transcript_62136/g.147220 Transcript_62136/m.147220 type:complete len:213 (+) Transcript_62136:38-676(+)